jgi:hypothetical protein
LASQWALPCGAGWFASAVGGGRARAFVKRRSEGLRSSSSLVDVCDIVVDSWSNMLWRLRRPLSFSLQREGRVP